MSDHQWKCAKWMGGEGQPCTCHSTAPTAPRERETPMMWCDLCDGTGNVEGIPGDCSRCTGVGQIPDPRPAPEPCSPAPVPPVAEAYCLAHDHATRDEETICSLRFQLAERDREHQEERRQLHELLWHVLEVAGGEVRIPRRALISSQRDKHIERDEDFATGATIYRSMTGPLPTPTPETYCEHDWQDLSWPGPPGSDPVEGTVQGCPKCRARRIVPKEATR